MELLIAILTSSTSIHANFGLKVALSNMSFSIELFFKERVSKLLSLQMSFSNFLLFLTSNITPLPSETSNVSSVSFGEFLKINADYKKFENIDINLRHREQELK